MARAMTLQKFASLGGKARARSLTKAERRASALKAVTARWARRRKNGPRPHRT